MQCKQEIYLLYVLFQFVYTQFFHYVSSFSPRRLAVLIRWQRKCKKTQNLSFLSSLQATLTFDAYSAVFDKSTYLLHCSTAHKRMVRSKKVGCWDWSEQAGQCESCSQNTVIVTNKRSVLQKKKLNECWPSCHWQELFLLSAC